jgi:cyclopropane-fatty-acyl-phospholipid synthase
MFLDKDLQYSCGYFPNNTETIDEAQLAKKIHIAAKLLLNRPDLTVLDIGCGWGGMAMTLAQDFGAIVLGVTLSEEQFHEAKIRSATRKLSNRVNFQLRDYRQINTKFDRIVSVGMFEHVGARNYSDYFSTIQRCLKPDGVALLHAIGRFDPPGGTNPWIEKYIFPGGYCPALSEVIAHIERSGLLITDIEILRLHYASTLAHWRNRFDAQRCRIAEIYDERFCRMFEFYLAGAQSAFELQEHMVFQIQIAHQQTAVPLTRDYMFKVENKLSKILSEEV